MARHAPKTYGAVCETPERQERRTAAALGGRRQAGSGSSAYAKGDAVVEAGPTVGPVGFLIECKQTVHASLSITWAWLAKISGEALAQGKAPALDFEVLGGPPAAGAERQWVAVPHSVFVQLVRAAGATQERVN